MKRFLSIALCFVMLLALVPFSAAALTYTGSESDPYVVSDYAALRSLMANAPDDGTTVYIKLGADILSKDIQNDYSLTLTKKNQNVVLDLAGYSITRESNITVDKGVIQAKNGVLTIKDSIGTGKVVAKGKIESAVAMYSTGLLEHDDGIVSIYGGTYYSESYNNAAVYNECADLYIFGGTFKGIGAGYGIFAAAGRTIIYGGTFYADDDEDSRSVYFGTDQLIEVYNLTAYGMVDSNSIQNDIWQYVHPTGKIYIDGVELTDKSKVDELIGNVIEFKTVMADKLEVFVDEPKEGNEIRNNAWTTTSGNYRIVRKNGENTMAWFECAEYNGNQFADGVFEKNKTYQVRVYVQVDVPVLPDICAEINGNEAILEFKLESDEGQRFYWIEYTFPEIEDPVLPYVEIEINTPKGGEIIQGGKIYSADQYDVLADWHTSPSNDIGGGYGNLNGKNVPYGTTIYATVYINAKNNYRFSSSTIVTINGQEYEFEWFAGETFPQYIMVRNVPFEISADGKPSEDTSSEESESKIKIGDINGNGRIDMADYVLLKRAYFGTYNLSDDQKIAGDINKNGKIDMADYVLLKRAYFGTYVIK